MFGARRREPLENWVDRYSGRIYALALRLLADRDDAEDVVQDVFERVFRDRDRARKVRDPERWLTRIAVNRVRDLLRARAAERRRVEREVLSRMTVGGGTAVHAPDALAIEEEKGALDTAIDELPDDLRVPLVLRYRADLSTRRIARLLGMPSSTVQARVKEAMERLRRRLSTRGVAGALIVLPSTSELEVLLAARGAPVPPVPSTLGPQLIEIARHTTPHAPWGAAIAAAGGVLMQKSVIISAAGMAIALAIGVGVGRGTSPAGDRRADASLESAALPRDTSDDRLPDSNSADLVAASWKARAERAESERDELAIELDGLRTQLSSALEPAPLPGLTADGRVDWSALSRLFQEHRAGLSIPFGQTGVDADPEAEDSLALLEAAWRNAGRAALAEDAFAFFDEGVLRGILDVVVGDTVGLSDVQRDRLERLATAAVREQALPADATPLEAAAARRHVVGEVLSGLPDLLESTQLEAWEEVSTRAPAFLSGQTGFRRFGAALEDKLPSAVLGAWRDAYGLDTQELDPLRARASNFVERSLEILDEHGALDGGSAVENESALELALLEFAAKFERELFAAMTPEQRERARGREPLIIEIRAGRSHILGHSGQAGF